MASFIDETNKKRPVTGLYDFFLICTDQNPFFSLALPIGVGTCGCGTFFLCLNNLNLLGACISP